jgi:gamma-tubulin complex component 3
LESQLTRKDDGIFDCGNLSLRRLLVWLEQPFERLKYLNVVCDAVRTKKGGLFLTTLYSYAEHGDLFKSALIKSALTKCITPIRDMIIEWIFDGQIRDSHDEVRSDQFDNRAETIAFLIDYFQSFS